MKLIVHMEGKGMNSSVFWRVEFSNSKRKKVFFSNTFITSGKPQSEVKTHKE